MRTWLSFSGDMEACRGEVSIVRDRVKRSATRNRQLCTIDNSYGFSLVSLEAFAFEGFSMDQARLLGAQSSFKN
jgi:hypothetical protein